MFGEITLSGILIIIGVLLVSMSIHEAMHAFVGLKLGDDTAAEEGRVSLNPLKHIDPFMTVLLPAITLILFHIPVMAAKPVPMVRDNIRFGDFGSALVGAAGPIANLMIAGLFAIIARLSGVDGITMDSIGGSIIYTFVVLNVALFVFNMIPFPPLDGSRVLYAFAPEPLQRIMEQLESIGIFIIFALVLYGGLDVLLSTMNSAVLHLLL